MDKTRIIAYAAAVSISVAASFGVSRAQTFPPGCYGAMAAGQTKFQTICPDQQATAASAQSALVSTVSGVSVYRFADPGYGSVCYVVPDTQVNLSTNGSTVFQSVGVPAISCIPALK